MQVTFLQTSDPFKYFDLLTITSAPVRLFCQRYGYSYSAYIGLKVGHASWHATYNRIPLLAELVRDGYDGWVIYLDADAYVADLEFDLHGLLSDHHDKSILGAPGGDQHWNINAGILFLNLSQPCCKNLINRWAENFEHEVGQRQLQQNTKPWDPNIKDDQVLLHEILATEVAVSAIYRLPLSLIGWPTSKFVRQLLRQYGEFEERLEQAKIDVAQVMSSSQSLLNLD